MTSPLSRSSRRSAGRALAIALGALVLVVLPSLAGSGTAGSGSARASSDLEPNSSIGLAAPIMSGEIVVGAIHAQADPEDWYVLTVPRGLAINVSLENLAPGGMNPDLELHYEGRDGRWERAWSITDFRYEALSVLSSVDESYYLRVWARWGGGSYRLQVDAYDPQVLTAGPTQGSVLWNNSYRVIDWYKVWLGTTGTTTDVLAVHLAKSGVGGAEPWLELRAYTLPAWTSEPALLDVSWGSLTQEDLLVAATSPGWVYLRINAFNGSGAYNLTLSITPGITDGDSVPSTGTGQFGSGTVDGALDQAVDHDDVIRLPLAAGETFSSNLILRNQVPGVYALTLLNPQGVRLSEVTNYRFGGENGTGADDLAPSIQLSATASAAGTYDLIATAKLAVNPARVADLWSSTASTSYTLHVLTSGHDRAPVLTGAEGTIRLREDTPAKVDLATLITDPDLPDGDLLVFLLLPGSGAGITASVVGTNLTLTPDPDWSGVSGLSVRAYDLYHQYVTLTLPVSVDPVNDPPTVIGSLGPLIIDHASTGVAPVAALFRDPDIPFGDQLAWSAVLGDPGAGTTDIAADSSLVVTPTAGGVTSLLVTATDTAGASAVLEIPVTLIRPNAAPALRSDRTSVVVLPEEGTLTLLLTDFAEDPDGTSLQFQVVGQGTWVGGTISGDSLTLTVLQPNRTGRERLGLAAQDALGQSVLFDLVAEVTPVPDAPVLIGVTPARDGLRPATWPAHFTVLAADGDGEPLQYRWTIDGLSAPVGTSATAFALEDPGPGSHLLRIVVIDPTGLAVERSWTVEGSPAPAVDSGVASRTVAVRAGAGFSLLALLLALVTEPGRYGLLKFVILPIYTKIRTEEVLDQFTRGRVYGYIEHHPGANYTTIRRALGVGNGTLAHHLTMLEKEGYVVSHIEGLYRRFYPSHGKVSKDVLEVSRVQADLLAAVEQRPGISQGEVAAQLVLSKRVIHYHVMALRRAGLIRIERDGRRSRLFAVTPEGRKVRARESIGRARTDSATDDGNPDPADLRTRAARDEPPALPAPTPAGARPGAAADGGTGPAGTPPDGPTRGSPPG